MEKRNRDDGSFRDPSGYIFHHSGNIYRTVHIEYQEHFDLLMSSGLYNDLVEKNLLIRHTDITQDVNISRNEYKILMPEQIPFISYPYEWSFGMLKDAALTTLSIMSRALSYGMILKDASAYNIQFLRGRPIFIDTLSFEKYCEGTPWIAYGQFCRHFLAPLALAAKKDIRLTKLLKSYLDGIPLELASELLPARTRFSLGLAIHIHAHAKAIANSTSAKVSGKLAKFSGTAMLALIDNLETTINSLTWTCPVTEWGNYYDNTNYSTAAFEDKKRIVRDQLADDDNEMVIDLGANDGTFSRIAAETGHSVISCDIDPVATEKSYLWVKEKSEERILPLVMDLMNPSPSCGWMGKERKSFLERLPEKTTVLALALIHHLSIRENVPLDGISEWLQGFSERAIIEFIPKDDSQVSEMLRLRKDVFPDYSQETFIESLSKVFSTFIIPIRDSNRSIIVNERQKREMGKG